MRGRGGCKNMLELAELIERAASHPLYAEWDLDENSRFGGNLWQALPTLRRSDLRPERTLAGNQEGPGEVIYFSSGTTGDPTLTRYSADDLARVGELCRRFSVLEGIGSHSRVMVLLPMSLWAVGKITTEGHRRAGAQVFPVDLHGGVDAWQQMADRIRPTVISSTPSVLASWAPDYRGPPLELVESTGEQLLECERRLIEARFGAFVHDAYGLSQCVVGVECRLRHGFHYWPDSVGIEIIDPYTDRIAPAGESGEIVVTNFMHARLPILRFRTGDFGRLLNEPCPCGCDKPRVLVEGRLGDGYDLSRAVTLRREELDAALEERGLKGTIRYKGRSGSPAETFVADRFVPTLELGFEQDIDQDALRNHLLAALPEVAELVHENELNLSIVRMGR